MVGLALMYQVADWQPSARAVYACSGNQGCVLAGYRNAIVSWEELAVVAGWIALAAAMALILTSTRSLRIREIRAISSA
jgi:hypothetical protein